MNKFATAQQTSTAKLPTFFQKFLKIVHALRGNETKVTWRRAFIVNLFTLESEKESKNNERTLFRDCPRILDLSVNPEAKNATYMWFSGLFQF